MVARRRMSFMDRQASRFVQGVEEERRQLSFATSRTWPWLLLYLALIAAPLAVAAVWLIFT
jgi:hypothetical protein